MEEEVQEEKRPPMNPYLAGVCLGLVLLASFVVLGVGLGASDGLARLAAWVQLLIAREATLQSPTFGPWGPRPLQHYLVFMLLGIFIGSFFSALLARRVRTAVERAPGFPIILRSLLAVVGGLLVGFAGRLAGGGSGGQVLTGMAQLMTGSFLFLLSLSVGAYGAAYFVRRQWHD